MRSLSARLLIALMLTLLAFCAIYLGFRYRQMSRERTGYWDMLLQDVARNILMFLPRGVERLSAYETFSLPFDTTVYQDLAIQLWTSDGHAFMRSPYAPEVPLRPDFRDGFAQVEIAGELWRVYAVSDSDRQIHVQVAKPYSALAAEKLFRLRYGLQASALIFLLLGSVVWIVVRWSLKPVDAIRTNLRRRDPLDLTPLPEGGLPLEVRSLVTSFNRALERLDLALQGERRFIADAAHELRTPLAALTAHAELAASAESPEQARVASQKLRSVVKRAARLSEQLLDSARLDAGGRGMVRERVDLSKLVATVTNDFETLARRRRQSLSLTVESCEITGDVDLLGILIRNLIDNALRHSGEGSRVVVSCRRHRRADGATVDLRVADDGPGVPAEERPRLFERFYRARNGGRPGSGVGLSLVSRVAALHEASIDAVTSPWGRGLEVTVRFPIPLPPPPV